MRPDDSVLPARLDGLTRRQTLLDRAFVVLTGHSGCTHKLAAGHSLVLGYGVTMAVRGDSELRLDESLGLAAHRTCLAAQGMRPLTCFVPTSSRVLFLSLS
jgi:hypothetical protein